MRGDTTESIEMFTAALAKRFEILQVMFLLHLEDDKNLFSHS